MAKDGDAFEQWLEGARIPQRRRSPERLAVLRAAFAFLEHSGQDYTSVRILAHFLWHCQLGLKVSQVARLVGVARMTASRQNKLSSREVVRSIQHRLSGRPYGKLLPRYAGPIAEFLVTHTEATRADVLDFIERTWQNKVLIGGSGVCRVDWRDAVWPFAAHGRRLAEAPGVERSGSFLPPHQPLGVAA
jgi:hypothetical protein